MLVKLANASNSRAKEKFDGLTTEFKALIPGLLVDVEGDKPLSVEAYSLLHKMLTLVERCPDAIILDDEDERPCHSRKRLESSKSQAA